MINKYSLYNGEIELEFDDGKHIYTVDDKIVDGVTTVIGIVDKSGPLIYWAVGKAINYIDSTIIPGEAMDEIEIKKMLDAASKQHRVRKKEAGDIGTMVHNWIERYIKGENPKMPVNKKINNGVSAFLKWKKKNNVEFTYSEKKVYSKKYNYAGTLDGEGKVNGKTAIIDFKTSKGIYNTMRYQVAAYLFAREEETGKKYKEAWIVRFGKKRNNKNEFDFETLKIPRKELKKDYQAFLGALILYRREKKLKYLKRSENNKLKNK